MPFPWEVPLYLALLSAPLWLPASMLVYHVATAPSMWRLGLRFLLALIAAGAPPLTACITVVKKLSH